MKPKKGDICLVTGASSGIGREISLLLSRKGLKVYGTSRRIEPGEVQDIDGVLFVGLDITDDLSVAGAIDLIMQKEGRIDLLVNNAGAGISGPVEDMSMPDALAQMDVCYFGTLRVIRAVLPHMRGRGGGRIVIIGSVGASAVLPYQTGYCAAKAALRALGQGLRGEAAQFNIDVVTVEPGDTKTGFSDARRICEIPNTSPYLPEMERALPKQVNRERTGMFPAKVANTVARAAFAKHPKARITVGFSYKAIDLALRLLPERITEKIIFAIVK